MKKMAKWTAALLVCLCLAVPALGEPGAILMNGDLPEVDWIYDSNLLRVSGSSGYSMNTIDGTALTGALYRSFSESNGYVKAELYNAPDPLNAGGLFDVTGATMMPFQYGDVRVESSEWALGVVLVSASADNYDYKNLSGDSFYLIQSVDVYHLPEGKCLATLTRDQFVDADAVNHCLNIQSRSDNVVSCYDADFNQVGTNLKGLSDDSCAPADFQIFRENGQCGVKDAAGNVIMQPSFSTVESYVRGGYFRVSTGECYGLADMNGNVVLPAEYDSIKSVTNAPLDENGASLSYVSHGYVAVVMDDKLGYAEVNGGVTCAPTYAQKSFDEISGMSATLTDLEGKLHIIAADGVETVIEGYDQVRSLTYSSGMFYRVANADGQYGMIDWHGNEVLPCQYGMITLSADGQYALVDSADYGSSSIYQLTYDEAGATAAPVAGEAPAEETPAESAPAEETPAGEAAAEEAPAGEAPAADYSSVVSVLNSAITLLQTDAAANQDAVIGLINGAVGTLGTEHAASVVLNSAVMLLEQDAAANGASVVAVLQSAIALLQ